MSNNYRRSSLSVRTRHIMHTSSYTPLFLPFPRLTHHTHLSPSLPSIFPRLPALPRDPMASRRFSERRWKRTKAQKRATTGAASSMVPPCSARSLPLSSRSSPVRWAGVESGRREGWYLSYCCTECFCAWCGGRGAVHVRPGPDPSQGGAGWVRPRSAGGKAHVGRVAAGPVRGED